MTTYLTQSGPRGTPVKRLLDDDSDQRESFFRHQRYLQRAVGKEQLRLSTSKYVLSSTQAYCSAVPSSGRDNSIPAVPYSCNPKILACIMCHSL